MAKILVIEDQKMLCQLYGSALAHAKHKVTRTYSGEEAVQAALRERHDLIIMDLKLPGISGLELARYLGEIGVLPETPLIIATASGEEAGSIAKLLKASALLRKPFHVSKLLAEVEKALAGAKQPVHVA